MKDMHFPCHIRFL